MEHWHLGNPGVGRYLSAVGEWESVFLNLQVIYDLLKKFLGSKLSAGDKECRAHIMANRIKHVSEDIRDGKLSSVGIPLWLTKDGFSTAKATLTYKEMGQLVRFMAQIADCLSLPSQATARFAELDEKLASDPGYEVGP